LDFKRLLNIAYPNQHYFKRLIHKNFICYCKNLIDSNKEILFIDDNNQVMIMFYGEIFNKCTLCSNLHISEDLSDPEFVYKLYLIEGNGFAEKLNGEFLIIIYFFEKKDIFLYRDHLGLCPVVYSLSNGTFYFSTDVIFLSSLLHIDKKINPEPFLSEFRFADLTQTSNNRVHKLLPGHYIKFCGIKLEIVKYWHPEKIKQDKKLTYNQVINDIGFLVNDAIRIRSNINLKASAHISGGLDSSLIAALVRKVYRNQETFYGYSWSPENIQLPKDSFDERQLIKEVCEGNYIKSFLVNLDLDDYINLPKKYITNFGFLSEEKVLDHAEANDVRIIFSGYGGDEFISFGGRGIDSDLLFNLNLKEFFLRNRNLTLKKLLKVIFFEVIFPFLHIIYPDQRKAHKAFTKYLKKPYRKNHYESMKKFIFYKSSRQLQLGLLYHYHLQDRLEKWYVNGFLHGVKYRYPLLDKRIIEYVLKIPSKLLLDREFSRMILRDISKDILPENVRWLKKGIDPAVVAQARQNCTSAALVYFTEINEFRANHDLDFIDFDILQKDAQKFKEDQNDQDIFISNLLIIKELHEFMKSYRSLCSNLRQNFTT